MRPPASAQARPTTPGPAQVQDSSLVIRVARSRGTRKRRVTLRRASLLELALANQSKQEEAAEEQGSPFRLMWHLQMLQGVGLRDERTELPSSSA